LKIEQSRLLIENRILKLAGMFSAPEQWQIGNFCCNANCAVAKPTFTCTRCQMFKYCPADCQHHAWKSGHKLVCKQSVRLKATDVSSMTLRNMKLQLELIEQMFSRNECDEIVNMSAEIVHSASLWRIVEIPIAVMMLYTKLAECYQRKDEFTIALEFLQFSLVLAQKMDRADMCPEKLWGHTPKKVFDNNVLEMQNLLISMYRSFSRICHAIEQYSKAGPTSKEALRLSENLGDRKQVMNSRKLLGTCLFRMGSYGEALVFHRETLSIVQEDNLFVSEDYPDVDFVTLKLQMTVMLKLQIARCYSLQRYFEAAIDIRKETWGLLCEMSLKCNLCTMSVDCKDCNRLKLITSMAMGESQSSFSYMLAVTGYWSCADSR